MGKRLVMVIILLVMVAGRIMVASNINRSNNIESAIKKSGQTIKKIILQRNVDGGKAIIFVDNNERIFSCFMQYGSFKSLKVVGKDLDGKEIYYDDIYWYYK